MGRPQNSNRAQRVLVVGGGAAGIAAARVLIGAGLEVVIAEAGHELGGNCAQLEVDGERIDAGVSDFNRTTFVQLAGLLDELGLETAPIGETASVVDESGALLWSSRSGALELGPAAGVGRDGARRLAADIDRFAREAPAVLDGPAPLTLGEYARLRRYDPAFVELYLEPRAAGAFPMPDARPADFDLRSLVAFFAAHGLVGARPRRRERVVGGMGAYVRAFADWFLGRGGQIRRRTRVLEIRRRARSVRVTADRDGRVVDERFDHVLVATNPALAAAILDADAEELAVLRSHPVQPGRVVVHRDTRLLPADRETWGAFNYVKSPGPRPPSITFVPRLLSGTGPDEVFVTLNPVIEPRAGRVLSDTWMPHPLACGATRRELAAIQGRRRAYFAGSYYAAPWVHEQAIASGADAAWKILADIADGAALPVATPAAASITNQ